MRCLGVPDDAASPLRARSLGEVERYARAAADVGDEAVSGVGASQVGRPVAMTRYVLAVTPRVHRTPKPDYLGAVCEGDADRVTSRPCSDARKSPNMAVLDQPQLAA